MVSPTQRKTQPPTTHAMQWGDMPAESRRDVSGQMRNLGMASSGVGEQRSKLEAVQGRAGSKATTIRKAGQRLASLDALGQHLTDTPITHQGAAGGRVSLVMQGGERTRNAPQDAPSNPGHDWYFQHNRKLDLVAHATGHAKDRVVAASAVMSPQNNPEQELTAVAALAHGHSNPNASITVTQRGAEANPALRDYVGRPTHPSKFSSEQLASLSEVGTREHVQAKGIDLASVAKGGVKGNVVKAIDVLRGHVAPGDAINPQTSPKVWSYHNNIAKSEYGTPEHEEFTHRMRTVTGLHDQRQLPGQQNMGRMYPGMRTATHGPLDPSGHTAEDTWQQAISTRQRLEVVDVPGRTGRAARQSPAKFSVGEGGQANQKYLRTPQGMSNVGPSASMHAWQNQATQVAGRILTKRSGEIVPTMGVQAGGWTEARRKAGKAIEEQTAAPRRKPEQGVQGTLF